ncbi:MAG: sensor histidine kinase [Alphaproteobacteria bacterium]|nr:sensor histidine kinase [Alphaproteobacteria bacterium]MBU1515161.1 sensor histidine kinase [Alphaproteobacteria bacterium]MBU2092291.1 sensor histidine kinase [Alphaproteobacteria bacterium]MBU2152885.1 sensor histidine kinase [Alphaproteobacteria bacterium]MBU2305716.1 sensor histidine kinase [Alphaproteobacteria bacterium]
MPLDFHLTAASDRELPLHLVEEISHRVANEYAEAIAGLSLAAAGDGRPDVRQVLKHAADRLHAHAEAHRALMPPIDGQVNLADYLGRLCATFSRATLADRCVRLSVDTDEIWLPADRAWRIGLTVAELIRNAARHGLRGRAGSIGVKVAQAGDDVVCAVCDDGSCVADTTPGRGVAVARALADDLGGSIEWLFTSRGCLARLRIPAAARVS